MLRFKLCTRLYCISISISLVQFLGCEGTKDGEFTRPNGVTVDDEGNIIVADSRNNRIQVRLIQISRTFHISVFTMCDGRCSPPPACS